MINSHMELSESDENYKIYHLMKGPNPYLDILIGPDHVTYASIHGLVYYRREDREKEYAIENHAKAIELLHMLQGLEQNLFLEKALRNQNNFIRKS